MQYTAETMLVKSKDKGQSGIFASITAADAGWEYLNLKALRLNKEQPYSDSTENCEVAFVILGGICHVQSSAGHFESVGQREDVFRGMPHAVYLPRNTDFTIEPQTDGFEVVSCWVETDRDYPAQLVTPAQVSVELRGGANASRQINSIIPPGFNCHRIVAVEVYTPGGNWSSYPPHKHDVHREAADGTLIEADLEEIYFYKFDRPGGYAYQRVYNGSGSIDGLMRPQQHDMVLVPEGYHPVVSAHGYTCYYLNFLAGSAQSLANSDDPEFTWVKDTWTWKDSRLPVVSDRDR
jgi:5-deoxy-glucuronate isomerase